MRQKKASNGATVSKRLYTVPECATYIGKTPGMIYQLVSERTIPFVKIGRSTLFDINDLDAFIEANKHGCQTDQDRPQ